MNERILGTMHIIQILLAIDSVLIYFCIPYRTSYHNENTYIQSSRVFLIGMDDYYLFGLLFVRLLLLLTMKEHYQKARVSLGMDLSVSTSKRLYL